MRHAAPLVVGLGLCAPALAAGAELEGYRALARSAEGRVLLACARAALESEPDAPPAACDADTLAWPARPAGIYVSLVRGNATRACVGSAAPPRGALAASVRAIATLARSADPRRPPVRREELAELRLVISFTSAGERVASPYEVNVGHEGLLVEGARGSVAFLPGEARTVQWALGEARRAGVLAAREPASYRRLEVVTLSEPARSNPRSDDDALP